MSDRAQTAMFQEEEVPVGPPEASEWGRFEIHHVDAFEWLAQAEGSSIHAVVTDPPYGLVEYSDRELAKLNGGRGGVWRIPPSFDGCARRALPRFTVLTEADRQGIAAFFQRLAEHLRRVLVPGAHVFVASQPLVSYLVCGAFADAGLEVRGQVVRTVRTLRGGDRPKNAHREFADVTVMPRSCWEPWLLFRKPCEGRVQDNLRRWGTGGLRRTSTDQPFADLVPSAPTRRAEHTLAPHPSLKPQAFLRKIVRAALPLGRGVILDSFMGSGSTIAAARACGLDSIGLEANREYFEMAQRAIPVLSALRVRERR